MSTIQNQGEQNWAVHVVWPRSLTASTSGLYGVCMAHSVAICAPRQMRTATQTMPAAFSTRRSLPTPIGSRI